MRAAATAAAAAALLLAGCASFSGFQPATPDGYDGPTVSVADQTQPVSGSLAHVFEMTRFEGRRLLSTSIATLQANQGRGFSITPVALTNEVPPGPARVRLQVVTQYAAPLLAMTHPTCRVEGEVAFTPEAGRRYRVAGRIDGRSCAVWIEDTATGRPVTEAVSGPGTGR
jgi:hypothetical protein